MTKVFIYRPIAKGECLAVAYSEDGNVLGQHYSSNLDYARYDMARFVPPDAEAVWRIGRPAMQAQIDAGNITGLSFESKS